MGKQENTYFDLFEEDEAEDTFSFFNLSLSDGENKTLQQSPRASSYQGDVFEFCNAIDDPENIPTTPSIVFCGKMMKQHEEEEEKFKGYQKRDYLSMVRSASSLKSSYNYDDTQGSNVNEKERCSFFKNRSSSARIDSEYNSIYSVSNAQTVNITALTSMSSKSRRWMFMFGPVKFMPEMEMSAIKQRQGKLAPNTIVSQVVAGQGTAVKGGGKAGKSDTRWQWGLLKSLRIRKSQLATMFGQIVWLRSCGGRRNMD